MNALQEAEQIYQKTQIMVNFINKTDFKLEIEKGSRVSYLYKLTLHGVLVGEFERIRDAYEYVAYCDWADDICRGPIVRLKQGKR